MNIILFCRIIVVDFSDVLRIGGSRSSDAQLRDKPLNGSTPASETNVHVSQEHNKKSD